MPRPVWVRSADDSGFAVVTATDRPVDVCIDGRRVWTFWTHRDTVPVAFPLDRGPWPIRRAHWPTPLRRHLDGRARITVVDSATGATYFDRDLALGGGEGEIRVRNKKGVDLGIDKSGRLVPTFAGRSTRDISALLDATEAVIEALRSAGVEPFVAYGTLLGAVREGKVLGHDSDADLGYVSKHSNPVDVARESFEVQRRLARDGWEISRYSGASFKIYVTEADVRRGLDVFGGFLDAGRLYLMGEIGTAFERDWIYPLSTAELDGRPVPVPARPEKLLEATYGPGWRTPDPAFKFTTPDRTIRAFDDWFRGVQPGLRHWDRKAAGASDGSALKKPSLLAKRAGKAAQKLDAEILDVGAGSGSDSLWLAKQGHTVTAYDYATRALAPAREHAAKDSLALDVRYLNLADRRSVLSEGARLAGRPRPRVVLARHVVDATSGLGRESLARLCSMALRDGGRLFAEFYRADEDVALPDWVLGRVDAEAFATLLRGAGASQVDVEDLQRKGRPIVRVVGVWS